MVFETYVLSSGFSLTSDTVRVFCRSYGYKLRKKLANFLLTATGGKAEPKVETSGETDEEDKYGYKLDAADIAFDYFKAKKWEDWYIDEEHALSRPPRKPTIYEMWEKDYLAKLGIKDERSKLGFYKFDANGECITVAGDNIWATMAYELNELLQLEPMQNPITTAG